MTVVALPTPDAPDDRLHEDALALSYVASDMDVRHVPAWGRWYVWSGAHWKLAEKLEPFDRVRRHLRKERGSYVSKKTADAAAKAATVAAVLRLAGSDPRVALAPDDLDNDAWLLATPGGTVDLRTGGLRPARREDHLTKSTTVAPARPPQELVSEAEMREHCPRWCQFIGEITGGDVRLMDYLARFAGYCLTGSTREQIFAFFYGTGANGKSTFTSTLLKLLGDYGCIAPADTFTEATHDRHPADLAMFRGARLVVAQETEEGRRWATARVKALTGGDPIAARFMRQDFFTFVPQFKLIVSGNHRPSLRHVDEAIRRRMHLVPFTVTIPPQERDPHLASKLEEELPGILLWCIYGIGGYLTEGLNPPESVLAATREYLDDENELEAWIAERCETGEDLRGPPTALFKSWAAWCRAAELAPGNTKQFAAKLQGAGYIRRRNGAERYYQGIALRQGELPA